MGRAGDWGRLRALVRPALPSQISESGYPGWRAVVATIGLLAVIINYEGTAPSGNDEIALRMAIVFWVLAMLWWVACRWGGLGSVLRFGDRAWPVGDYTLLAISAWAFGAQHPGVLALAMARATMTGVGTGLAWMTLGWVLVLGASLGGQAQSTHSHVWPLLAMVVSWAMAWKVRELIDERATSERARDEQRKLLGMLSHEMRSPLHVITGAAGLIAREGLADRDRQLLGSIDESARALNELVDEALEMSALGQGPRLVPTEFRIHHLVARLEERLGPLAARGSIQLLWSIDDQIPVVSGSKRHIEQVVFNLASNAIKYTRAGGTVRISIHHYREDGAGSSRVTLVFSVADTGIGIADDKKPRLFEAFTQVSDGAARRYDGVGHGLHIVRTLSEAMDGHIEVSDNPGGGTVFTWQVALELAARSGKGAAISEIQALAEHRSKTRTLRCLVVDDHANSRMVMRAFLAQGGHRVREAVSGLDGLEAIREGGLDIVFLDQHMPDVSGWDVLEGIKASPGWAKAPMVVMVSGAWDEATSKQALEQGASEYLPKPVDFNEVLRVLRRRAMQLDSFHGIRTSS